MLLAKVELKDECGKLDQKWFATEPKDDELREDTEETTREIQDSCSVVDGRCWRIVRGLQESQKTP